MLPFDEGGAGDDLVRFHKLSSDLPRLDGGRRLRFVHSTS
jgi:hypothetical protein